jgi:signal transduction histidine kinase
VFTVTFPERWPERELPLSLRRNLLLMAVEALHNAAQHAQATHVTLGIETDGTALRLRVEDDGRGFSPDVLTADQRPGLGLTSMQRRAREMGGEVAWRERPGGGTVVEVVVDLGGGRARLA